MLCVCKGEPCLCKKGKSGGFVCFDVSFVLLVPKATHHLWGRNCRNLTPRQGGSKIHTGDQTLLAAGVCSQLSFSTSHSSLSLSPQFKNPLILLLLASALVSVITKEYEDAASITMVCATCALSPWCVTPVLHHPAV